MTKKHFFIFLLIALIYWTASWFGYGFYMHRISAVGWSQFVFMRIPIALGAIFTLGYLVIQAIVLNKNNSALIKTKVFLSILGICLVGLCAFVVSLIRNPVHQKEVLDFFAGRKSYSLTTLAPLVLDVEGMDMVFCFILAFISGRLTYSSGADFDPKGFVRAILIWLLILSISEAFQHFATFRVGEISDVAFNMLGAAIGLSLSSGWFWRKSLS